MKVGLSSMQDNNPGICGNPPKNDYSPGNRGGRGARVACPHHYRSRKSRLRIGENVTRQPVKAGNVHPLKKTYLPKWRHLMALLPDIPILISLYALLFRKVVTSQW